MEDILSFNVRVKHIPKRENSLADFMSRKLHSTKEAPDIPRHMPVAMVAIMYEGTVLDKKLMDLVEAGSEDEDYQDILECIASKQKLNDQHPAQQYKKI